MAVNGFPMMPQGAGIGSIAPFRWYCQTILPAVFDDSLSYYEVVAKIADKLNEIIKQVNAIGDNGVKELQERVLELQKELEEFKSHGFDDYYKEQVAKWIEDNLDYVFHVIVNQVFFGITADGYFVAYIPESWSDISFDTGMVYGNESYGRLILSYDVDSVHGVIQPERR